MHDELRARETGRAGERELARGGDVGADPLLAQQSEHGDVGEGLRSVEDAPALADGAPQRPSLRAKRLLAVHDERRAEPLRELGRGDPTEPELAVLDACRLREEIEHPWILPGTVFGP